jgi:RHS repeat-associated protein
MYWIHPDHLGGASVLVNSGGKVTNWYEYMPYGEMLMELSNQDYNNPYKYNGKEFDEATGYYYYGARYYDPKRSFWISVDPLAEITQSPYTYVWNDPVNFADPSGMLGERVGGEVNGDPKKRSWLRKAIDWILGRKNRVVVTPGEMTGHREPDNSSNELPWYLNKSKYGGKPVLTLGAHNIELPYLERAEYGNNIFENGDTFLKNTVGAMYNGVASTWNEGMAGKEGCSFMYEGDSDMESAVRHVSRGNANATEIEGIAAMAIMHKVGGEFGRAGEGLTGNNWEFNPVKDLDMRGGTTHIVALEEAFKRTGVPRELFTLSKWGKDVNGKSIPVEYQGPGGAYVNMDIPEFNNVKSTGKLGEGPHQPHIGYQTMGRGANRIRGHIFIDNVPASR